MLCRNYQSIPYQRMRKKIHLTFIFAVLSHSSHQYRGQTERQQQANNANNIFSFSFDSSNHRHRDKVLLLQKISCCNMQFVQEIKKPAKKCCLNHRGKKTKRRNRKRSLLCDSGEKHEAKEVEVAGQKREILSTQPGMKSTGGFLRL